MSLFPLRAIYQGYWDKLSKEDYPHEGLMEDAEYGRAVVENFFWDYFVQYSDARPILRTARELEGKDLRLAHDLMRWSYSPLWFYRVQERHARTAKLLNLGNQKIHTVHHAGRMPEPGAGVLLRILPFRGLEYCGHTALVFESGPSAARLESLFREGCRELGVKSTVTIRPDVHCEEWRRHGAVFLSLWRAEVYDSQVGRPRRGSLPSAPYELVVPDLQVLGVALAGRADVEPAGAGVWNLRHRGLKLARLEAKGSSLQVTLSDSAFQGTVRAWLTERLGGIAWRPEGSSEARSARDVGSGKASGIPAQARKKTLGKESMADLSNADQDAWVHAPADALNGQTPIQASLHDWGRRRLTLLLREMQQSGKDISGLQRQLGL